MASGFVFFQHSTMIEKGPKRAMLLLLLSCWLASLASPAQLPANVKPVNTIIGKTSPLSAASASFSTATQIIGAKLPEKEKERFSDFFNQITPTMTINPDWAKEIEPAALLNKLTQATSKVEEEKKPATRQTLKAKIQAVKTVPKKLQIVKETPITPVSEDIRNVFMKMTETKNTVTKSIPVPQFDLSAWVLKNTPTDTNKDFDLAALTGTKDFNIAALAMRMTPTESSKVDMKKPAVKQVLKAVPMKQSAKASVFKKPVKAIVPMKQPVKATVPLKQQPVKASTVPVKQPPAVGKVAPKVGTASVKPVVKAADKPAWFSKPAVQSVVKPVEQKKAIETKVTPIVKATPVAAKQSVPTKVSETTKPQEISKPALKPVPVPLISVVGKTSPLSAASASFSTAKEIIGAKLAEKEMGKEGVDLSAVTNIFAQLQGLGSKKLTEVKLLDKKTVAPKVSNVKPVVNVAIKPVAKLAVTSVIKPVVVAKPAELKKAADKNVQQKSRSPQGSKLIVAPEKKSEYNWEQGRYAFSLLPLAPGDRRKTLLAEVVKGTIWTLDQIQGIINVNVPVRAVVVKLTGGGLLIYNPVGPTDENLALVRGLEAKHGPVKHIVLASLGLEHKAFAGPFSQAFPEATVWLQPGQWSFPFNLPPSLLGFPKEAGRVKEIPLKASDAPWFKDFDHCVLEKLSFKSVGGFGETAFFHRSTGTLLVTDAVIKVGSEPPPIIQEDPRAILYHSRDSIKDEVNDTPDARRRGYRRMALFSLFFYPSGIQVTPLSNALTELSTVSSQARILGEGSLPFAGLYPWTWVTSEEKNFQALQGGLLVAPILRKLILDREPRKVLAWADKVSQWPMKRIIPSHFENNIAVSSGAEFRAAFKFLEPPRAVPLNGYNPSKGAAQPDVNDLGLLDTVSDLFTSLGIVAASQVAKRVN